MDHVETCATPFTSREAAARGWGRRRLADAVRTGQVQRVHRGVYVGGLVELTVAVRVRALQHVLPRRSYASHETAAVLWGVDCTSPRSAAPDVPEILRVTVAPGRRAGDRPGVRASEGGLLPADVATVDGLALTSPGRTAVDLARERTLVEAVVVMDAFLHSGLVTHAELTERTATPSLERGVRTARAALQHADPAAESPMETRLRMLLVLAGLPPPASQQEVRDPRDRVVARVDLAYVDERLAIEYDGREAHLEPGRFLHDRHRHHDLRELGWEVLRFTADDVLRDRGGVEGRVRRFLVTRRRAA